MKRIFLAVATVAVVAAAGWNYWQSKKTPRLSELALANIEALARGEEDSGEHGTGKCYRTITDKEGSKILYCATCTYIKNSTDSWVSGTGECK